MPKRTIAGKTGSQLKVTEGLTGESQVQATAALDAVIANDDKAKGGKINSLIKTKIPVFNGYFTYTLLPELFFEQFDVKLDRGVPDGWKQILIKSESEASSTAPKGTERNQRPPGATKNKRRVVGKKVVVPLKEGNEIERTLVGKPDATKTIRRLYLRFPSMCPHMAIAIWLSQVIEASKMPPEIKIEQLSFPMPVTGAYTSLVVPKWVKAG